MTRSLADIAADLRAKAEAWGVGFVIDPLADEIEALDAHYVRRPDPDMIAELRGYLKWLRLDIGAYQFANQLERFLDTIDPPPPADDDVVLVALPRAVAELWSSDRAGGYGPTAAKVREATRAALAARPPADPFPAPAPDTDEGSA